VDPEFIRDLFVQFRPVTVKRMFSGAGIFADGLMFGLIVDGAIHLKVDETNIADFEREGSRPFTYTRGKSSGRPTRHALPYWRLPERLYDDPDELAVWAGRAFAIAERKKFAPRAERSENLDRASSSHERSLRSCELRPLTKNSADRRRYRA
jgi:DNA transformation protein